MSIQTANRSSFFLLRDRIEREIAKSLAAFGSKTKLRDACEYALLGGGKRLRPIIVMMIAESLGHSLDVSLAALSVEFFHTASLIADDLPCMDNDDERRDKPALHKVYGESIALLASYTLMTAAFEKIHENTQLMRTAPPPFNSFADEAGRIALSTATRCGGILGATGGQFLDLFPPNQSLEMVREVIYKKTVTLFEVSFVLGWVFGGGAFDRVDDVKQAAYHMGMAFQIVDDLGDLVQDDKGQNEINIARVIGKERALNLFHHEMEQFRGGIKTLGLSTPSFEKMADLLVRQAAASAS
ncbi:MAG: Farnesyl diphosphate synthase [Chlamydiae bacterium]|nr:Farnesyl diphosphate synthase [Chlamydiota bacterium]